jgi:hypothetical protein
VPTTRLTRLAGDPARAACDHHYRGRPRWRKRCLPPLQATMTAASKARIPGGLARS